MTHEELTVHVEVLEERLGPITTKSSKRRKSRHHLFSAPKAHLSRWGWLNPIADPMQDIAWKVVGFGEQIH